MLPSHSITASPTTITRAVSPLSETSPTARRAPVCTTFSSVVVLRSASAVLTYSALAGPVEVSRMRPTSASTVR
ncbi:hypothetical protein ACFQBS_16920 [Planomonospora parontospora]|uniref:hypothetical protein n=1 Tax=Planomonospora parontospora TaxID=58119 RepID=UPI0036153309